MLLTSLPLTLKTVFREPGRGLGVEQMSRVTLTHSEVNRGQVAVTRTKIMAHLGWQGCSASWFPVLHTGTQRPGEVKRGKTNTADSIWVSKHSPFPLLTHSQTAEPTAPLSPGKCMGHIHPSAEFQVVNDRRACLVVQVLGLQVPSSGGPSSTPGQGIRSHMPQSRAGAAK